MTTENFLFLSLDAALIGDIAWQVSKEGCSVKYYIEAESDSDIADGFVEKTNNWRDELDWADIIVIDDIWIGNEVGTGELAEELRSKGHRVIGGSPGTDKLEDDRGYAMTVLEENNVDVLPHREFHSFDEGINHVEQNPAPYVIKPLGEVQNVKRLLYVGREQDGGDVIDVLEAYRKAWGHRMKGFQLQRRAEGVEAAICGFFNGERFIEPINLNFEHKKLFPGNIGPSTGEMGTSMLWTQRNRLFKETLGELEEWLATQGFHGSMDLNCIVNNEGVHPLEFTPRFGYPTISLQQEGIQTPISRVLAALSKGEDPDMETHNGYQVAVRICLPPFPFDDDKTFNENTRNAAIIFENQNREGIHIEDTKKVDDQWRVAGESGIALIATGKGATMKEAQRQVYNRIQRITIPNMYYRDDIGERWIQNDGDVLQSTGYLGP